MTLFCGLFKVGSDPRPPDWPGIEALARSLFRIGRPVVERRQGPGFALAWADAGVHEGGVERVAEKGLSLVAGDPILAGPSRRRSADLDRLHSDWEAGRFDSIRDARGSFCGVHLDLSRRRLVLVTDKLGLRPVYYAAIGNTIVFASAMRILRAIGFVPNEGDLQGLAETAAFGFALGARSINRHIRSLEPAEWLEADDSGVRSRTYWRWDEVGVVEASVDETCEDLRDAFAEAIRLRMNDSGRAVSMLSGGLDSRAVVAQLRAYGAEVHSIGFGAEGSADQILGRAASIRLGTRHFELAHGSTEFWARLACAHAEWLAGSGGFLTGPAALRVWSGEGGDRVMAPVNLVEDIVSAMRQGEPDAAARTYMRLERISLPGRIFRRSVRGTMLSLPLAGIAGELARFEPPDPARRFHLYVLLNESRRNIKRIFEDADLAPIELITPFYDSRFVETALKYPFDLFIGHRLYHRWLDFLPGGIATIPWQAYPTSLPCPLRLPEGVRTQWDPGYYSPAEEAGRVSETCDLARTVMRSKSFPSWLLNRPELTVAWLLLELGAHSFGYLFNAAQPFVDCPPSRQDP